MISQPVRALTERVQCSCILFPPTDKRVRDTDNSTFVHVKWANDALTEVGLWADDCIVGPILLDIGAAKKRYPMVLLRYQEV
jgi:Holliday junction resolvase RusA-like endonuclease